MTSFDLIYAPRAWEMLRQSFEECPAFWSEKELLYVHCGGPEGNSSQLRRYAAKNLHMKPSDEIYDNLNVAS